MIRLGVRRLSDFSSDYRGLSGKIRWLLTRGSVSCEILETCTGESGTEAFNAIVRDLRISAGVCRTTARGRFRDFDPVVLDAVERLFEPSCKLEVHDWAASDCLTSAEWATALFARFTHATVTASDLMLYLLRVSVEGNPGLYIIEPGGTVHQYVWGPFVCRLNPPEPASALVNRWLAQRAARRWEDVVGRVQLLHARMGEKQEIASDGLSLRKLPLIHPDAVALRDSDARFHIVRHSAFEALPEPVHVIRTMNIFNNGYFSPDQLRQGAATVFASLKPGGLWIVGRTQGQHGSHTATLFKRDKERFTSILRVNGGSEIESVVSDAVSVLPLTF